jgi:hypothetical protein
MEWAGPDRLCHVASPLGSPTDDLVSCCEHYCFVHSCDVRACGAMRAWWTCRRNLHQVFEVLGYCSRGLPCAFARISGSRFFKVSVLVLVVLFGCLYQVSGIHHCSTSSRSLSTSRKGTCSSICSLSSSYSCGRLLLAFDLMIWYEMTFSHSLMPASSILSNCQNIVCSCPRMKLSSWSSSSSLHAPAIILGNNDCMYVHCMCIFFLPTMTPPRRIKRKRCFVLFSLEVEKSVAR